MSTRNQERAVENIIKQEMSGKRVNLGKALRESGYSESVATKPKTVTGTVGFKEAMAKYGLTEEKWASYLAADLEMKPGERLGELRLAADVMGLAAHNINLSVQKSDESMDMIQQIIVSQDETNSRAD